MTMKCYKDDEKAGRQTIRIAETLKLKKLVSHNLSILGAVWITKGDGLFQLANIFGH